MNLGTSVLRAGVGAGAIVLLMPWSNGARSAPRDLEALGTLPEITAIDHRVHGRGNIGFTVTNLGVFGAFPGSGFPWSNGPSLEWPKNSGTEYLWGMALWLGALKHLQPAVTTGAFPLEFRAGSTELDVLYAAHEETLGGQRYPSADEDDDADGAIDEDWLDGRDNDGDGAIDEDFAAVSNEMFFCEYNDTDPGIVLSNPDHNPLALLVQQQSMVWRNGQRDDIVGLSYRFINKGFDPLIRVYVAFLVDFDIGRREAPNISRDDRAGFWEGIVTAGTGEHSVKLSIAYMFDADGDFGVAEGYAGLVFLGARRIGAGMDVPLSNFRMFSGASSYPQGGDPTTDEEKFETMEGTDPRPLPPPDPSTGLRPSVVSSTSNDYRILLSAGPFNVVEPGDSLEADFALVIGPGFDGMVEHAKQAKLLYDGAWFDRDGDPTTGVDGREHQVRWYADVSTPVALEEFRAAAHAAGVRLSWSLSASALEDVSNVVVLRSESAAGPFVPITTRTLPARQSMAFEDPNVDVGRSYWYRLRLVLADGSAQNSHTIRADAQAAPHGALRLDVSQHEAQAIEIGYWIATAPVAVRVRVFDVAGREVRAWNEGVRANGAYQIVWDRTSASGLRLARGTYFVQLQAGREQLTRKLVLAQP